MRSIIRVAVSCVAASVALLAASAPASAAPKRIKGELTKSGYTVIALAANGKATSVRAKRRGFRLTPPASRVTLHLRALNGRYAGPIVLAERQRARNEIRRAKRKVGQSKGNVRRARRTGKGLRKATRQLRKARSQLRKARRLLRQTRNRATVGVRAGARLGRIRIHSGYAKLSKPLRSGWADRSRFARARREVPIGAGRFGRVRSTRIRRGAPGDRDLDGIPDPLDIDDDGDLILDDADADPAGGAAATMAQQGSLVLSATTALSLPSPLGRTESTIVNANAPGLSDEQIQSGLRADGTILIGGLNVVFPSEASELDCAGDPKAKPPRPGLSYCSAGGTGRRFNIFDPNPMPFPACCDPDGDGFGSLGPRELRILHGAGADEIRGGDPLLVRGTTGAGEQAEVIASPATVLATVPAIAYYVDELGTRHDVPYPVTPGTDLPVVDGDDADSDVSVRLAFWRPQRRAIPGELPPGAGSWIDIGGLGHFAGGHFPDPRPCPQSSYSAVGQELVPSPGFPPNFTWFLLVDSVADQAANPANTFGYTLNLSQCGASHGDSPFGPGRRRSFAFTAALSPQAGQPNNTAGSTYTFHHQP